MTNRVTRGEASEESQVCGSALCPVWDCMGGNNGACRRRPLECADAGDPRPSCDRLLAGAGTTGVEPGAVRQVWRLGPQDAQSPLRPGLERSDAGAAPTLQ